MSASPSPVLLANTIANSANLCHAGGINSMTSISNTINNIGMGMGMGMSMGMSVGNGNSNTGNSIISTVPLLDQFAKSASRPEGNQLMPTGLIVRPLEPAPLQLLTVSRSTQPSPHSTPVSAPVTSTAPVMTQVHVDTSHLPHFTVRQDLADIHRLCQQLNGLLEF
ncbi:unnamed protein product [Protopolystoma xenopodis]|uniref:Uncharacterized protein n=1 Tax=Protopolystoma xenopodis TaxID=117903 RepID=A0A3S5AX14_9PLAT|nr:unnamed protein product [Protopolystoma xenopodis]